MDNIRDRGDQYLFFLGYVARLRKHQLFSAIKKHDDINIDPWSSENIFEYCPNNYSLSRTIQSYHIYEKAKNPDLVNQLFYLLKEFYFLSSDYIPPCCEDGRAFYVKNHTNIGLLCERCGSIYDLDGRKISMQDAIHMTNKDFNLILPESTKSDWPFRDKLRALLHNE